MRELGAIHCYAPAGNTRAGLSRDPQKRDAKWARGSRSQTHRRAAKGGFTQDDGKVERRLASPIADRLVCSFCCSKSSDCSWVLKKLGPWYLVPILPVTVLRVKPIAGAITRTPGASRGLELGTRGRSGAHTLLSWDVALLKRHL